MVKGEGRLLTCFGRKSSNSCALGDASSNRGLLCLEMKEPRRISAQTCLRLPHLDFTMTGPSKNRVRKWQSSCDFVVGTSSMLIMDDGEKQEEARGFGGFDRNSQNAKCKSERIRVFWSVAAASRVQK